MMVCVCEQCLTNKNCFYFFFTRGHQCAIDVAAIGTGTACGSIVNLTEKSFLRMDGRNDEVFIQKKKKIILQLLK